MDIDEPAQAGTRDAALLQAVLALAADLDLPSLLKRFVDASTELTGARYGAINILDEHGTSTTFVQNGFDDLTVAALGHAPHAIGVLGQIPAHGVLRLEDLTKHPAYLGLPPSHPPLGSFLGTAVRVREKVFGYLYLSEKAGGFEDSDEDLVTALAAAAAVAIQNAELYALAVKRENWVRAGQQITTMLLEGAEEEDVLAQIASTAREIAGADTAALVLPGMADALVMEIVEGQAQDKLLGLAMVPEGRAWAAFESGVSALVPSLAIAPTPQLEPLRLFGPALYTPLRTAGKSVGVLMLLRRVDSPPFTDNDLVMTKSFAAQAALAFILAEARHAQDVAALLDERERIARDLHDLAIQQLFATGLQLETVGRRAALGGDGAEIAGLINGALDGVDSSVRQIRMIVHSLHDPAAGGASLVERLRREATLSRGGLGFAPSLLITADGVVVDTSDNELLGRIDDVVGADRANDVVAVAREGLTNAARHAKATSVAVRVSVNGSGPSGRIVIEVEDDGAGLDETRDRHSGTKNLAARARQDGGTFSLTAPPSGVGTLLTWQAPLD
ncbi:GAF domain-containing sensor histidine kinase [Pengzhenrongella sp.]|jgi:signal transduction histidine kinase|uniref:sensor histidine kinase n=1 Tax=Pengzhenrongella sp. TaxID=2888820 RepID=UPI002F95FD27